MSGSDDQHLVISNPFNGKVKVKVVPYSITSIMERVVVFIEFVFPRSFCLPAVHAGHEVESETVAYKICNKP